MSASAPQPETRLRASEFQLKPIEDAPKSLQDKLIRNRNPLTGFLFSVFSHTVLLVMLLLLVSTEPIKNPGIRVLAEVERDNENLTEQPLADHPHTVQIEAPDDNSSPLEAEQTDVTHQIEMPLAQLESETVRPTREFNPTPALELNLAPEIPQLTLPTGGGLTGRHPTSRGALAAARGGSLASEQAVEDGLRWILAHQGKDGSWGFLHQKVGGCNCDHQGQRESKTAATGLSLMALLGAGYTHRQGPYRTEIKRGLDYLVKNMRSNGGWMGDSDKMYAHPIAVIALSEAFQMTGDQALAEAVENGRAYIELAQNKTDSKRKGSWGYYAGAAGDITVTGWHLMALKSCQAAGFPTPKETWQLAERFVDQMGSSNSTFGYDHPDKVTPATTAIGLFAKMHLGMPHESGLLEDGGNWLAERGPSNSDIYFDYYATQVLFHRQGKDWLEWNQQLRDYLIATQVKGGGHLHGSWYFEDQHGKIGGRLYTTAMAVMTLEVYYRYLPLYEGLGSTTEPIPSVSDTDVRPKNR